MNHSIVVFLWNRVPEHEIVSIAVSESSTIFTGSTKGDVCLWKVNQDTAKLTLEPVALMCPGRSAIQQLVVGWGSEFEEVVLSIDSQGNVCKWSSQDGRCIQNCPGLLKHAVPSTSVSTFCDNRYVALSGPSAVIEVLDLWFPQIVHRVQCGSIDIVAVLPFDLESNVEAQSSSSGDNVITTPEDVAFISLDLDCVFRLWNWHEQRTRIAVSHSCRVSLPRGSKSSSIPRFRDVAARSGVIVMLWCSTWAVFEQSELRSPSFEPKMSLEGRRPPVLSNSKNRPEWIKVKFADTTTIVLLDSADRMFVYSIDRKDLSLKQRRCLVNSGNVSLVPVLACSKSSENKHIMVARPSQDNALMIWTSSLEYDDQEEKNIVIQACAKSRIQDGFPSSSTSLCSTIGSIEIVEKVKINTASAAEARRMNIPLSSLRVPQTHHHVSLFRASGHSDGSICVVGIPRSRNGKDLRIINKIGSSDAVCALQFGPSRWISSSRDDVRIARVSLISGTIKGTVCVRELELSVYQDSDLIEIRDLNRSTYFNKNMAQLEHNTGEDKCVCLYRVWSDKAKAPQCLYQYRGHESHVVSLRWHHLDMCVLHALCTDGTVWIWSTVSGTLERIVSARTLYDTTDLMPLSSSSSPTSVDSESRAIELVKLPRSPLAEGELTARDVPADAFAMHVRQIASMLKFSALDALRNKSATSSPISSNLFAHHPNISFLLAWGIDKELDRLYTQELGLVPPPEMYAFGFYGKGETVTALLPSTTRGSGRWCFSPNLTALHNLALVALFMTPLKCKLHQGLFSKLITNYGVVFPEKLAPRYKEASLRMLGVCGLARWEEGHVAARLLLQCTIERMNASVRLQKASQWAARLHREPSRFDNNNKNSPGNGNRRRPRSRSPGRSPVMGSTDGKKKGPTISYSKSEGRRKNSNSVSPPSKNLPPTLSLHVVRDASAENDNTISPRDQRSDGSRRSRSVSPSPRRAKEKGSFSKLSSEEDIIVMILSVIAIAHPEEIAQLTAQRISAVRDVRARSARISLFLIHLLRGLTHVTCTTNNIPHSQQYHSNMLRKYLKIQVLLGFLKSDNSIRSAFAAEIIGKGFDLWRPYIQNLKALIRRLLVLTIPSKYSGGASVVAAAQRALMEIGQREPLMFVNATGREILRPDVGSRHHCTALLALVALVNKYPAPLLRHLPAVVEAVIRSLDPSEPELRKGCLKASTRALHELVKRFPMVAFHQPTQRYAVGTVEAVIVIYDLRTATKWRILSGHNRALSAVSFVDTGDVLVSYSADESCVKVWRAGSSGMLGGILGIQGSCLKTIQLSKKGSSSSSSNTSSSSPKKNTSTPIVSSADILKNCSIRWTSRQTVLLTLEDGRKVNLKVL